MNLQIQAQYIEFIRGAETIAHVEGLEERILKAYGEISDTLKIVISNQKALIESDNVRKALQ